VAGNLSANDTNISPRGDILETAEGRAYAENESFTLSKLKDSPEAETYAAKACAAVGAAQTIITAAEKQPPETCPSHEPV